MVRYYKTKIVIWSNRDPGDMEISHLARDAEDGLSICTSMASELVENPETDPEFTEDAVSFFADDDEEA